MGVIKVEHIEFDLTGTSGTLSILDVGSTSSAFIRNTVSGRQTAGRTDDTNTTKHNFHGGTIEMTAVDELTFSRYNATGTVKFMCEVWRYDGAVGGDHEFIKRAQEVVTFGSTETSKTIAISGIVNKDRVVPFLVSQSLDSTGNSEFNDSRFICYINPGDELVVRRNGSGSAAEVVVDVVEFTGSSWSVGFGSITDWKESANKTCTLNDAYNLAGSTYTANWEDGFIETSFEGDTAESGLSDVLLTWNDPGTGSGSVLTLGSGDGNARNDGDLRVYFVENPDMNVKRASADKTIPQGSDTTLTFPSITPSALDEAALEWYVDTSGTGQAFARGFVGGILTSTSAIKAWVHRSGNAGDYRYGVIDLSGLTESVSGMSSNPSFNVSTANELKGSGRLDATGGLAGSLPPGLSNSASFSASEPYMYGTGKVGTSGALAINKNSSIKGSGKVLFDDTITLDIAHTLKGTGALASAPSFNFDISGSIKSYAALAAGLQVDFDQNTVLKSILQASASLSWSIEQTSSILGLAKMTSALAIAVQNSLTMKGSGSLTSGPTINVSKVANIAGIGLIRASLDVPLNIGSAISGPGKLSASPQMTITTLSDMRGSGSMEVSMDSIFTTTTPIKGAGRLVSQMQLEKTISAALNSDSEGSAVLAFEIGVSADLKGTASAAAMLETSVVILSGIKATASMASSIPLAITLAADLMNATTLSSTMGISLVSSSEVKGVGRIVGSMVLNVDNISELKGSASISSNHILRITQQSDALSIAKIQASLQAALQQQSELKGVGHIFVQMPIITEISASTSGTSLMSSVLSIELTFDASGNLLGVEIPVKEVDSRITTSQTLDSTICPEWTLSSTIMTTQTLDSAICTDTTLDSVVEELILDSPINNP